jgi:DNA-directed RNA polymerase specialized sigma24 family protein
MGRPRKHPEPERDPNWGPSGELVAKVHYLAWRWSRDRPDYLEDLYQEGLLAIWLNGETQAPLNHQLRTAQNRMLSVRKLGKSVDGKLDQGYQRATPWGVVFLDGFDPPSAGGSGTEEQALSRVALQEFMAILERHEIETLVLAYQGFKYREIALRTGQSLRRLQRTMKSIRKKVWPYLYGDEVPAAAETGVNPGAANQQTGP